MFKNNRVIIAIATFLILILSVVAATLISKNRESVTCALMQNEYYLGGEAVGIKLLATGVLVMGIDRDDTSLQVGDIILEVNGCKIETDAELEKYVALGEMLNLTVSRDEKIINIKIAPKYNETSQNYRLGIWVKDSSAGVGTVTFYDAQTQKFAALGHAITETANQYVLPITTGGITRTDIHSIKKGMPKAPGELKGTITNETIGQICSNTQNGIFGYIKDKSYFENNQKIEIGKKEDIETKEAKIYLTLDDNVKKEYTIQIEKVFLTSTGNKNIAIKITDEELLEKTGGIVQGMSGAPIVQNGKLIGAITHVLLDDPKRGYGAFIENMIDDMNNI